MNYFKHIVMSLAAVLAANDISIAQSYTLLPNDSIVITSVLEDVETLSIQQLNISTDTIVLKWEKVNESVPANWEAYVCDNSFCNTGLVDSGTMNPVIPGDYGLLLLHITAHIDTGTAIIGYAIWDSNNVSMKDTLTFSMSVNAITSTNKAEERNKIKIFPIPSNYTTNILTNFNEGFTFTIVDLNGKKIKSGISPGQNYSIPVQGLYNGWYTIIIFSSGKFICSEKIQIQH